MSSAPGGSKTDVMTDDFRRTTGGGEQQQKQRKKPQKKRRGKQRKDSENKLPVAGRPRGGDQHARYGIRHGWHTGTGKHTGASG